MTHDRWFAVFQMADLKSQFVSHIDTEAEIDKHIERMIESGDVKLVRKMRVDDLPNSDEPQA